MADRDAAFEAWAHGCAPRLLRTAVLLCGDRGTAEDLVQDVLERLYVAWPRVADPDAYARRALVNATTSRWRYRARRPETSVAEVVDVDARDRTPVLDARRDLVVALARLPPGQRAVVVLRYLEDQTEAATAAALGISTGTVKSQASRALARLHTLLEPAPQDDVDEECVR